MPNFIRKPDEIEAVQWNGKNIDEIKKLLPEGEEIMNYGGILNIGELSDRWILSVGSFLAKDRDGIFVMQSEDFRRLYEEKC